MPNIDLASIIKWVLRILILLSVAASVMAIFANVGAGTATVTAIRSEVYEDGTATTDLRPVTVAAWAVGFPFADVVGMEADYSWVPTMIIDSTLALASLLILLAVYAWVQRVFP